MNDLISRQAAIDAISLFFDKAYIEDADVHKNDALYELNLVPTAEKKGKWVRDTGQYYQVLRCDQCGHVTVEQVRNYCPNCGAKMDGGEE